MLEALDGQLEGGRPMVSVTVGAFAAESEVADILRDTEASHPGSAVGSYPFTRDGRFGANFVIRSEDGRLAQETGDDLTRRLREAGFDPVEGGI
jgi:molybdopterin-biosynthesis enzyme MoeA-like protein